MNVSAFDAATREKYVEVEFVDADFNAFQLACRDKDVTLYQSEEEAKEKLEAGTYVDKKHAFYYPDNPYVKTYPDRVIAQIVAVMGEGEEKRIGYQIVAVSNL